MRIDPSINNRVGFTPDKFDGWLWLDGDKIWISFIVSKQPKLGHLTELLNKIEGNGFKVIVPDPLKIMEAICRKRGMRVFYQERKEGTLRYMAKEKISNN